VIYTRNTTESINLVAYSWARANLKAGDLVILTEMEHHSNLVPWHMLQAERGIELEFIPVTEDGLLDLETYKSLLSTGTRNWSRLRTCPTSSARSTLRAEIIQTGS
jgi:cysteine desulfurase/selenocysteine lyase